MTSVPHDQELTVRPLAGPEELGLFCRLAYVLDHELEDDVATGRRRPEWMWVALRGERLLGRLSWWTPRAGEPPCALDFFDLDDTLAEPERGEIGLHLLETASAAVLPAGAPRPEYGRFIPAHWRDDAAARDVVEARMRVLERTGARLLVERLRLEWRPGTPLPEPTGRLTFRGADDQEELLALMTLVLEGTLDAHSRADLASGLSPREAAEFQFEEEFAALTSPREWWRIAELPDGGGPVGFVLPARNNYHHIIAYIGVVPAHRGHGYIDDILAEGTRVLAARDVPRIRAATDLGNVPMAKAFERAGYVNFERSVNMTWS
ncbi:GNAT family N-acetyltransferase [Streptomyces agglomeratus]|uniref:GNAT family N-acetyltransferase n=1 Tax=Streptomyces agglomeratus TaxID=285458 RepID=A0A1E5P4L6_9ACTN|nr:GNAT family N-acetyltransferase [Streptomyces agglomeratus]OEJ24481.1 GNAT family N-acetyltransferase [Streptomyces agglomeratus]OEJ41568.1 GNAT family N-acetyltransferase [Streptomyces agglomeratus]OEJ44054.1 GNAT family N-acetyltransferase [Streptomyces agglomeratus]OEJ54058.1 GNAT family N-acetyltransferase [Streptomyces agglomeratus]OEJ61431.1 GNAT family N-acetyltransferase [Streptomyces agglomeratus]